MEILSMAIYLLIAWVSRADEESDLRSVLLNEFYGELASETIDSLFMRQQTTLTPPITDIQSLRILCQQHNQPCSSSAECSSGFLCRDQKCKKVFSAQTKSCFYHRNCDKYSRCLWGICIPSSDYSFIRSLDSPLTGTNGFLTEYKNTELERIRAWLHSYDFCKGLESVFTNRLLSYKENEKIERPSRFLSTNSMTGYDVGSELLHVGSLKYLVTEVAGLGGGSFVVAYADYESVNPEYFNYRIYDSNDSGGTRNQLNNVSGDLEAISLSTLSNGNFIAAYVILSSGSKYIYYGIFTSSGSSVSIDVLVESLSGSSDLSISVAGLEDGKFVIVWDENTGEGNGSYGILGNLYNSDQTIASSTFRINTYTTNDQKKPKVAALSGGGFIVAWQSDQQDGSDFGIYAQQYLSDATKDGSEIQLSDNQNYSQKDVDIVGLATSGYAATWVRDSGADKRIECKSSVSSIALVDSNTVSGTESSAPSVAKLENDQFVIAWANIQSGSTYGNIYFQHFNSDNSTASEIGQIQTTGKTPHVSNIGGSSYVIAWISSSTNSLARSVRKCSVLNCASCIGDTVSCSACIAGYYFDGSQCQTCTSPCIECSAAGEDQCTLCTGNILPSNPPNYCECPTSTYQSVSDPVTCASCDSSCSECNGSSDSNCTVCSDITKTPASPQGYCSCPTGTFENNSNPVDCVSCHSECQECIGTSSNQCTSCNNSEVPQSPTGYCVCPSGMYDSGSSVVVCSNCDSTCAECIGSGSDMCTACNDSSVPESPSGYCQCPDGTYPSTNNPVTCVPCSSECTICDSSVCLECHSLFELRNGACICPTGEYEVQSSPLVCEICDSTCSECSSESVCTACKTGLVLNDSQCRCPRSSVLVESSLECVDCPENCEECFCEGCESGFNDSSVLVCSSCKENYFVKFGQCAVCPENCLECEAEDRCKVCESTFVLNSSNLCVCPLHYKEEAGVCVYSPLSYRLIDNESYFSIQFSEDLRSDLSLENIESSYFVPNRSSFQIQIERESSSTYRVKINSESIPEGSTGMMIELRDIVSVSGNTIQSDNLTIEEESSESDLEKKLVDEGSEEEETLGSISPEAASSGTIAAGASVSAVSSLASGNPSTIWVFLNVVNLIYYMPLQNTGLPVSIQEFNKNLDIEFVEMVPENGESKRPQFYKSEDSPKNWFYYGIKTTNLIENTRSALASFILGILLLLLVILLYFCIKKWRKFFLNRLNDLKWGYFYRLWIIFYIKIIVAAVLSTGKVIFIQMDNENSEQYLGLILLLFGLGSIIALTVIIYRNQDKISKNEESMKSYATFFDEFKCNRGFMSMIYYPIFLLRRYTYILGLYYLENYPLVQVINNSLFSAATVVHLIVYQPFKESSLNLMNIIFEINITIMFTISGVFLIELSKDTEDTLALVLFILAASIVGVALLIMLFKLREVCLSMKKAKKNIVNPICSTINETNVIQIEQVFSQPQNSLKITPGEEELEVLDID